MGTKYCFVQMVKVIGNGARLKYCDDCNYWKMKIWTCLQKIQKTDLSSKSLSDDPKEKGSSQVPIFVTLF